MTKNNSEKKAMKLAKGIEKQERSEVHPNKKILKAAKDLEKHEKGEMKGRK